MSIIVIYVSVFISYHIILYLYLFVCNNNEHIHSYIGIINNILKQLIIFVYYLLYMVIIFIYNIQQFPSKYTDIIIILLQIFVSILYIYAYIHLYTYIHIYNNNITIMMIAKQSPKYISQNILTIYNKEIDRWLDNVQMYCKGEQTQWPIVSEYYRLVFLQNIRKKMGIKVVFDISVVHVIMSRLQHPGFIMFRYRDGLTMNQIKLCKQYMVEEKWIYILKMAQVLCQSQFITIKNYKQIINKLCKQNCIEYRLQTLYQLYLQNDKDMLAILKVWTNVVGIKCQDFWLKHVYQWPNLVKNSEILIKIFQILYNYLQQKMSIKNMTKLKNLIFNLDNHYQQIANFLCLFNYPKKVKDIQHQLQLLKTKILQYFSTKVYDRQIVDFQTYGSFRNKICLQSSDVDMTIFVLKKEKDQTSQQRKLICDTLLKVHSALRWIAQFDNSQLQIQKQSIFSVTTEKIKVPFLRVKFDNGMPFNQMDIVVNNEYGVKNSKMLQKFTNNLFIRNLAVLVKKWAKRNRLITTYRLSSYGLTLMLLYYLMCIGQLNFPTFQQLQNLSFSNQTRNSQSLQVIFMLFFDFYSQSSRFHRNRQTACIIKNCNDHSLIFQQQFVINIHDPFDFSNPGRLKQRDQMEFFQCISKTQQQLKLIKKMSEQAKSQAVHDFFGISYEEILQ